MSPTDGMLLPAPDDDSQPFWDACAQGELRVQRCAGCVRLRFPPRPMCPWCHTFDHEWALMSGRAAIWSFVVAHPPLLPAYAAQAPYNVIVVTLDEDPTIRMVGNLVPSAGARLDAIDPTTIQIGAPVTVVFDPTTALPQWTRP